MGKMKSEERLNDDLFFFISNMLSNLCMAPFVYRGGIGSVKRRRWKENLEIKLTKFQCKQYIK